MQMLAQAYHDLISIALAANPGEFERLSSAGEIDAVSNLSRLATSYPANAQGNLHSIVPIVIDAQGHIPNQLQDLLLQLFGGYGLASALDAAVNHYRASGSWPDVLPNCPDAANQDPPGRIPHAQLGSGRDSLACRNSAQHADEGNLSDFDDSELAQAMQLSLQSSGTSSPSDGYLTSLPLRPGSQVCVARPEGGALGSSETPNRNNDEDDFDVLSSHKPYKHHCEAPAPLLVRPLATGLIMARLMLLQTWSLQFRFLPKLKTNIATM